MSNYTIYTVEDKSGRVHTVKVPEEKDWTDKVSDWVQKTILRLVGGGIIFTIGYIMGLGAGGF